jgi:hypothetical protein
VKKKGFVIANDAEEYLAEYSVSRGAITRAWAATPELAFVFHTIHKADEVVKNLESSYPLYVLGIMETKKQIGVFPPREGHYPRWLFE